MWALLIPLPKVPPLVLAAKVIGDHNDHHALYDMTCWILDGLGQANLHVVSVASDGTEVERVYQNLLIKKADSHIQYMITLPHDLPDIQPLKFVIPVLNGFQFMVVQDSNHCRKTGRNNLFSGARLLVLGNYTASYELIHNIAEEPGSPLYMTDITKGNK